MLMALYKLLIQQMNLLRRFSIGGICLKTDQTKTVALLTWSAHNVTLHHGFLIVVFIEDELIKTPISALRMFNGETKERETNI